MAPSLASSSPSGSRGCSNKRGGESVWRPGAGHNVLFPTSPSFVSAFRLPRTRPRFPTLHDVWGRESEDLSVPRCLLPFLSLAFSPQRRSLSLVTAQSNHGSENTRDHPWPNFSAYRRNRRGGTVRGLPAPFSAQLDLWTWRRDTPSR